MATDFSSASCIIVCFSAWEEDRKDYACAIFFQPCVQKPCLKYVEMDLNSRLLGCRQNKLMRLQRCARVREFMLQKSYFGVIFKQNHGPQGNIKLLLTGQLLFFFTTKIFNLFHANSRAAAASKVQSSNSVRAVTVLWGN